MKTIQCHRWILIECIFLLTVGFLGADSTPRLQVRWSVKVGYSSGNLRYAQGIILTTYQQEGVMAVNASTGAVRWKRKMENAPEHLVMAGGVGIGATTDQLTCFRIADGTILWYKRPPVAKKTWRTGHYEWDDRVSVAGGKLFALATPPVRFPSVGVPPDSHVSAVVQAIAIREGKVLWSRRMPGVDGGRLLGVGQRVYGLLLYQRKPYLRLVGWNLGNGAVTYTMPLPEETDWLSAVLLAGHLFSASDERPYWVRAFAVASRRKTWDAYLNGRLLPTGLIASETGGHKKRLLVATLAGLEVFSPITGSIVWKNRFVHLPTVASVKAVMDERFVYVLEEVPPLPKGPTGQLSVLDPGDGTRLATVDLPGKINPNASLVAAGGAVYVSCRGEEGDILTRFDVLEQ